MNHQIYINYQGIKEYLSIKMTGFACLKFFTYFFLIYFNILTFHCLKEIRYFEDFEYLNKKILINISIFLTVLNLVWLKVVDSNLLCKYNIIVVSILKKSL